MTRIALALLAFILLLPLSGAAQEAAPDSPPTGIKPFGEPVSDLQARLELARLLSYVQRYAESVQQYRKVLAVQPDHLQARLELARVLFWSGDTAAAAGLLEKIPEKDLDPESRLTLAELYMARKEYAKAEHLLRGVLKEKPGDDAARFKLAEMLSWQKRYPESLALFRKLLARRPDDVQLRRRLALVLAASGDKDGAIAELRRSLGE